MSTPDAARAALLNTAREFNGGRYFEAHEALEDALDELPEELWDLFIGVIQIAVGYHKAAQGLATSAGAMLDRGVEKCASFPADAAGLDIGALRTRARSDAEALRGGRFDPEEFRRHPPRLRFV